MAEGAREAEAREPWVMEMAVVEMATVVVVRVAETKARVVEGLAVVDMGDSVVATQHLVGAEVGAVRAAGVMAMVEEATAMAEGSGRVVLGRVAVAMATAGEVTASAVVAIWHLRRSATRSQLTSRLNTTRRLCLPTRRPHWDRPHFCSLIFSGRSRRNCKA